MFAFARIRVFIEMGAIKVTESSAIFGKVRWHPIQEDTDTLPVHIIDEVLKVFRRTKAAGWRIIAGDLVAPGGIIGILTHRHQFNMSKAQVFDIWSQGVRQLPVRQEAVFFRITLSMSFRDMPP